MMIRYLRHPDGRHWRAQARDDVVEVQTWADGEAPKVEEIDTWDEFGQPAEYSLDTMASPLFEQGYDVAPIPDVHLAIEAAHEQVLPARVRAFYASGAYLERQYWHCRALGCEVDFVADAVLGNYLEEYRDAESGEPRAFVPISSKIFGETEDEQQWIGIDPEESPTAVYDLYTSGAYKRVYDTFDAFLADLEESAEE